LHFSKVYEELLLNLHFWISPVPSKMKKSFPETSTYSPIPTFTISKQSSAKSMYSELS